MSEERFDVSATAHDAKDQIVYHSVDDHILAVDDHILAHGKTSQAGAQILARTA
jgi:hypothetical protein